MPAGYNIRLINHDSTLATLAALKARDTKLEAPLISFTATTLGTAWTDNHQYCSREELPAGISLYGIIAFLLKENFAPSKPPKLEPQKNTSPFAKLFGR